MTGGGCVKRYFLAHGMNEEEKPVSDYGTGAASQNLYPIGAGIANPSKPNASSSNISQIVFLIIFFAIILGWICVALATRTLDNFTFHVLKMDEKSFFDTLLIFIFVIIFFSTFVWVIDINNIVSGGLRNEYANANDPILGYQQKNANSTAILNRYTGSRSVSPAVLFPGIVFRLSRLTSLESSHEHLGGEGAIKIDLNDEIRIQPIEIILKRNITTKKIRSLTFEIIIINKLEKL